MNLKRKFVGHTVAVVALVALVLSLVWGWVTLTDISAALVFTLVGTIVAVLYWTWRPEINQWFSEKNQPKLNIALTEVRPDEEVKTVEVWFRNGEKRSHEARFCFITITNSGKRTAKKVRLYCGPHQMLLMPFKGKVDYRANCLTSREDFDDALGEFGVETFVIATMNGVRQKDETCIHPSPAGERFVLFFTMKDFDPLIVPGFTRIYEHPQGSPPTVKLFLEVHYEDALGYYSAEFEVMMESWDNFKPKLVKTVFRPYS